MKKAFSLFISVLFALSSCRPDVYHLSPDKMEKVISDIQLAEVAATMAGYDTAQKTTMMSNDSLAVFYAEVLKHHEISLLQFRQSLDWYRQHPDQLDTIYHKAMSKLGPVAK